MEEDFSRYNGENTILRKTQLREVEILVEIDKICSSHNLTYWIDFGTLLGAVRHKGFIPWDDDLDITMPSEDYNKFISLAENELPQWLFLQTGKSDPSYKRKLCKVRDLNSLFVERHDDFTLPYKKGIFVDVFEAIEYPKISKSLLKSLSKWAKKTEYFYLFPQYITLKNIVAGIFFPIINAFVNLIWKICCFNKSDNIGYPLTFNPYNTWINKNVIFPLSRIEFEGRLFLAPNNPDKYLRNIYHDYMKLPAEKDRWIHSKFIFFKDKNENTI